MGLGKQNIPAMHLSKTVLFWIGINLLFFLFILGKRLFSNYAGNATTLPPNPYISPEVINRDRVSFYGKFPIHQGDVVFIGNSLTEGMPVQEMYENVKNRGISGNTIPMLITRLPQITAAHPSKIFVEIGINDIANGDTITSIKQHFETLIRSIQKQSPTAKIYIQSLTPTCLDKINLLPTIKEVNSFYQQFAAANNITFIDLYHPLLHNDILDSSYTLDGLHINYKGYEIWKKQIDQFIK